MSLGKMVGCGPFSNLRPLFWLMRLPGNGELEESSCFLQTLSLWKSSAFGSIPLWSIIHIERIILSKMKPHEHKRNPSKFAKSVVFRHIRSFSTWQTSKRTFRPIKNCHCLFGMKSSLTQIRINGLSFASRLLLRLPLFLQDKLWQVGILSNFHFDFGPKSPFSFITSSFHSGAKMHKKGELNK